MRRPQRLCYAVAHDVAFGPVYDPDIGLAVDLTDFKKGFLFFKDYRFYKNSDNMYYFIVAWLRSVCRPVLYKQSRRFMLQKLCCRAGTTKENVLLV